MAPEKEPFIVVQPKSQSAFVEDEFSFRVQAGGALPLAYQWRFNGETIFNATNATLVLTNVKFGEAGEYKVAVANSFGEVTSAVVRLTVKPLARLTVRSGLNNEGFELVVTGAVGRSYRIQASTDLKTWTDLFNFSNSEQTTLFLDSNAASFSRRFYRVASP